MNISTALVATIHSKLVQEMLSRGSTEVTLNIYSHVVQGFHREAAVLLDAFTVACGDEAAV